MNQRAYKLQQRPTLAGWLCKEKHTKHFSTRIGYVHKFRRYWCVLQKDYIAFYKHPDDRTPKDYILLKDFFVRNLKSDDGAKYQFVIGDRIKKLEHEFQADSNEDYHEWMSALCELLIKNSNTSDSDLASLSSTFTGGSEADNSSIIQPHSLPSSTSLNKLIMRAANLPLSTIIGSNEDLQGGSCGGGSKRNSGNMSNSANANLNNINSNNNNQPSYSSSRESSPGGVQFATGAGANSRDSSPSLIYRK